MATAARRPSAKRAPVPAKTPAAKPAAALPPASEPPTEPAGSAKKSTAKKPKRIRGNFSMPESDYARIDRLKATARRAGLKVKKNELLRMGLQALQSLTSAELQDCILALRLPGKRRKGS